MLLRFGLHGAAQSTKPNNLKGDIMAKRSMKKAVRVAPKKPGAFTVWRARAKELLEAQDDLLTANADCQDTILKQAQEIDDLERRLRKREDLLNDVQLIVERQQQVIKDIRQRAQRTETTLQALVAYTAAEKITGPEWRLLLPDVREGGIDHASSENVGAAVQSKMAAKDGI